MNELIKKENEFNDKLQEILRKKTYEKRSI